MFTPTPPPPSVAQAGRAQTYTFPYRDKMASLVHFVSLIPFTIAILQWEELIGRPGLTFEPGFPLNNHICIG